MAHEGGFIVVKIWLDNPRLGHEKKKIKDIIGHMQKPFAKSKGLEFKTYENYSVMHSSYFMFHTENINSKIIFSEQYSLYCQ